MLRPICGLLLILFGAGLVVGGMIDTNPEHLADWFAAMLFFTPPSYWLGNWMVHGSPWLIQVRKECRLPVGAVKLFGEVFAGIVMYWTALSVVSAIAGSRWFECVLFAVTFRFAWGIRKEAVRQRYMSAVLAEHREDDEEDDGPGGDDDSSGPIHPVAPTGKVKVA